MLPTLKPCPHLSTPTPVLITLHGRQGCVACRWHPRNLDELLVPILEPLDVDGGETLCPRCRAAVFVRPMASGGCLVVNPDGTQHRHRAVASPAPAARPAGQRLPSPARPAGVRLPPVGRPR